MRVETKTRILSVLVVVFLGLVMGRMAHGAGLKEKDYQFPWCEEAMGIAEFRLADATRVDCLTDTHAWEFDWARKWHEGLGQALYYAAVTGQRAGVVLILQDVKDHRYMRRLKTAIDGHKLPVDVELVAGYPEPEPE